MKNILFALLLFANFIGCVSNKNTHNELNGEYHGTFTAEYADGSIFSNKVMVTFTNNNYHSTGNEDRIPAGGNGIYELSGDKIIFHDENFWTADFDWNLILNKEYDYAINGQKLIISVIREGGNHYKYELVKQ